MGSYNDELKQAGVLLDLAGLLPSVEGRRVRFSGGRRAVIDGPFPESKQLVAGYWILQVASMDEAVEWAERFPFEAFSRIYPGEYGAESEIEIRQVFEPGEAFYMPPGHVPAAVAGTELVMFSPQDELAVAEAAMRENMQLTMQKANRNSSP